MSYCQHYSDSEPTPLKRIDENEPETSPYDLDNLTEWEKDFVEAMSNDDLFEVIIAANYMDIKPLLDLGCKVIAKKIRGKTPDEIDAMFEDNEGSDRNAVKKEIMAQIKE